MSATNLIEEKKESLLLALSDAMSHTEGFKNIINHGEIEINAFSITFWVNFTGSKGLKSVYVKVPKYIFYDKKINFLSPLTQKDRDLAKGEYTSLNELLLNWDKLNGVSFVKPLGYVEEYNAIITDRVFGSFLFKDYRKSDATKFYTLKNTDDVSLSLYNFGKSLKAFHDKSSTKHKFLAINFYEKFKLYTDFLEKEGVSKGFLSGLLNTLFEYKDFEDSSFLVKNLKGIDVRQILVDKERHMHVMDPGKISEGFREVSIARFIVTCRIVYWGSIRSFLYFTPNRFYENNFLRGYFGKDNYNSIILSILILKELLKQWKVLHEALLKRKWPSLIKFFFRKGYIDPFYKRLIEKELAYLKKMINLGHNKIKT